MRSEDVIGTSAVTPDDIDRIFIALENERRTVGNVVGGRGEANLKKVIAAAREIRGERNTLSGGFPRDHQAHRRGNRGTRGPLGRRRAPRARASSCDAALTAFA